MLGFSLSKCISLKKSNRSFVHDTCKNVVHEMRYILFTVVSVCTGTID